MQVAARGQIWPWRAGNGLPLMQRSPPVTQVASGKRAPGRRSSSVWAPELLADWRAGGWNLTPGGKELELRVFSKGCCLRGCDLKQLPLTLTWCDSWGKKFFILKFTLRPRGSLKQRAFFFSSPGNFQGLSCFWATYLAFHIFVRLVAFSLFDVWYYSILVIECRTLLLFK